MSTSNFQHRPPSIRNLDERIFAIDSSRAKPFRDRSAPASTLPERDHKRIRLRDGHASQVERPRSRRNGLGYRNRAHRCPRGCSRRAQLKQKSHQTWHASGVTTRRACNEPHRQDGNPGGGHATGQAIVVGQGRRRHPARAGQIPGMTPPRGQAFQESQRAPGDPVALAIGSPFTATAQGPEHDRRVSARKSYPVTRAAPGLCPGGPRS